MGLARKSAAVVGLAAITLAATGLDPAAAAKKAKSCTLLKASQMSKVLGDPVSGPDTTGTLQIACSFDIGAGLGDPGGGMVIVSYYSGSLAKGVYGASKASAEKIAGKKALWDVNSESAMVFKNGKLVMVSVSYTSDDPPAENLKPQLAQLAELAAKKL